MRLIISSRSRKGNSLGYILMLIMKIMFHPMRTSNTGYSVGKIMRGDLEKKKNKYLQHFQALLIHRQN